MEAISHPSRTPVIMLVDDNPANLQLLGGMLGRSLEFDLSFASSGLEALEAMASLVPDIVLLDVNMPGLDGFEVCRRVRARAETKHVPIIFLTAQGDSDSIVRGFRVGGSDYVVKPFEPQELLARVRVQLELHWSRLELTRLNNELMRLNRELELLSKTDGLLRIANRRAFDEALKREWQRAVRNGRRISLLILDVDHFKKYNDRYGHLQGDDCLKKVAEVVVRSARRSADLVGRYGGEELAVILPETAPDKAGYVAELIHQALRDAGIPHDASPVAPKVTVSIGVATMSPEIGAASDDLIRLADDALYAAKRDGRNRTRSSVEVGSGRASPSPP